MKFSYQNPLWPDYFADPFVLAWNGVYYAYGTRPLSDDPQDTQLFQVLSSQDLVRWTRLGQALERPQPLGDAGPLTACWAPEVAERDGMFYMYYSCAGSAGDETHSLRVAVATHPAGPFRDTGRLLLPDEGFTIDAHPFRDPKDGRWHLFFAKDFFDVPVGTGIAVVPLAEDMLSVAGPVTPVLRASAGWQVFARARSIYGRVWDTWHTLEGPSVVEHDGRYYCFYSGGPWHAPAYGVSYGVAERVQGPYRDAWSQQGPSVLRGIPGKVLGPGHNSLVRAPDSQRLLMVYHAWDAAQSARRMCIDPLVWTADGPRCLGPTTEPQTIEL